MRLCAASKYLVSLINGPYTIQIISFDPTHPERRKNAYQSGLRWQPGAAGDMWCSQNYLKGQMS